MAHYSQCSCNRKRWVDSRDHEVKLECSGSSKAVDMRRSATIRECDIVGGSVDWPTRTLKDSTKWKISGGKAKPM